MRDFFLCSNALTEQIRDLKKGKMNNHNRVKEVCTTTDNGSLRSKTSATTIINHCDDTILTTRPC